MKRLPVILTGFALCVQWGTAAVAQVTTAAAPPEAASLEQLLERVAGVRDEERARFDERVAEFAATEDALREAKLEAAIEQRDAAAAAADALADQYAANETAINERNRELVAKATSLGLAELFGIARQVAADTATGLQQSLVTTQFAPAAGQPPRDEALRQFAASRTVPTPADLEQLWLEIQREMTASGQVARYATRVVEPSGAATETDVVRIGPFTATADGRFLGYSPALRALQVLPRQLPGEFMETAARFDAAAAGSYAAAVVDSARGVLLALYVERPTFVERIELGEWVGYVIIVVGLAGMLAFVYQLATLIAVRIKVGRQLKSLDEPRADNPLGRVLLAFKGQPSRIEQDADIAELRISEAVLREVPRLERFQAFLRLGVAAGPLLGLIGTVVGMIITFQSITESGSSDPKLMADGIGQAMIATVLGLGIAIPLLFANALLTSLSRTVVQILDEQSAGMLAESIERRRGV